MAVVGRSPAAIAGEVQKAYDAGSQVEPFTKSEPGFDLVSAYAVTAQLRKLRVGRGSTQIGRKVGFTNRAAWTEGVTDPIWGDMYDSTVTFLKDEMASPTRFPLPHLSEIKIEPEIYFKIARPLSPEMDERALLAGIEWIGHGFEIVHSIYPGWRCKQADAVASGGMHGSYFAGTPKPVAAWSNDELLAKLPEFSVTLECDGKVAEVGRGVNVLGGPLLVLKHLVTMLARDSENPPLRPGEIVTTGTLTAALPVAPGERWSTRFDGIELDGLTLQF